MLKKSKAYKILKARHSIAESKLSEIQQLCEYVLQDIVNKKNKELTKPQVKTVRKNIKKIRKIIKASTK